ncbi:hypothetical protein SSX86_030318 [Deinandra increscens subsp. villosa]|uniref:Uncharacterized protein n=1 Tax=Deinandra increscens subsp. villosa TaxID=3103831 RepID=A0AAP0GJB9_9ASTR
MAISLRFTPPPPPISPSRRYNLPQAINLFHSNQFPDLPFGFRQHSRRITPRALTEWREYEQAVKDKDLGRALRFLQEIPQPDDDYSIDSRNGNPLKLLELQRDWEVLDTCLNADDMRLVAAAYAFLKDKGFLNQFAKYRSIVLEGPRDVTPTVLKSSTGLEVSKLSPKKWGLSTSSGVILAAFFAGLSFLVDQGVDLRPQLAVILGVIHGGFHISWWFMFSPNIKFVASIQAAYPCSRSRTSSSYLMGCPVRGVILDPIVAMQMGIQGQAGTQFWDENLQNELAEGRLTGVAFDRYCMVLFGGIAAEALVYGEAEGGENDENLFRSICLLLEPPLSVAQMSNQARWSVLQSYNLLKWHKHAHTAAVKALENGSCLSVVIRSIEEAMAANR